MLTPAATTAVRTYKMLQRSGLAYQMMSLECADTQIIKLSINNLRMSLCDSEGYYHDCDRLVNKGHFENNRYRRRSPGQKASNNYAFVKTIYDPQHTLSKKRYKRLLADRSDGFCFDVPYSLNKHERWKKVNDPSLPSIRPTWMSETILVTQQVKSTCFYDELPSRTITSKQVNDYDNAMEISSTKRRKTKRSHIKHSDEKGQLERDGVEPAEIHLDIIRLPCHAAPKAQGSKNGTTRRHPMSDPIAYDYDCSDREDDLGCSSEDLSNPDFSEIQQTQRTITLRDYLFYEQPSTSTRRVRKNPGDSELSCSCEIISVKPPVLIDVSEATNSTHIFEIIDVKVNEMHSADLRQQITPLVPGYCTLQWFGEKRACVKTKPTYKLFFALFFELESDRRTLRVRINTNTPFCAEYSRVDLLKMLAKRQKFKSLFTDLLKFILETIETEPHEHEDNRNRETKKRFLPETNSERLAVKAIRACERDQIAFIEPHYIFDDFEIVCSVEEDPAICCRCISPYKTDLFLTLYGTMCRQCIASYVVRQLRLSRFPLQIPLVSATGSSSIDLLYAILPRSVVSLVIKKSYAHFYTLEHPEAVFARCPQCSVPVVVSHKSEFGTCKCSECGCFWCYLCTSEPHWPMNCLEFREWKKKWDAQYFFEEFNLDERERVLSIECRCGRIFFAPENSAHGVICPDKRCKGRFEQEGLINSAYLFRRKFWAQYRKEVHKRGDKEGYPCTTDYLEPKKLIYKQFVKVCIEARRERFNETKRKEYEEAARKAFPSKAGTGIAIVLRKTVLYLAENCTAWLYLHRSDRHRHLKSTVSQILRSFLELQEELLHPRPGFNIRVENLRRDMNNLITMFCQLVKN
ncbi:hypothetical protein Y032_0638g969 [Ancylostoma ceylanicum]|uniref:Uncharacterized protein n=1 Tax=Ancylostoma ceylanicum TaxID=53326 RepID=A0A016WJN0_9BILA|nr:hypothetical protein Y032_0638g969 [Ancylostoma ceylanicum]